MKKLDTSSCTSSRIMYMKDGHFEFLQQAHEETVKDFIIANIPSYNSSKIYVLYGVSVSSFGGNYLFSEGAVFCNGEVYHSPAQSVPITSGTTICSLAITYYGTHADPTDFNDSTTTNVCNIRTVVYSIGASGTGNLNGGASSDNDFPNIINYLTANGYNSLVSDISTLNGDISTLNGDVTTINGNITTLNTNVTNLETIPSWTNVTTEWASGYWTTGGSGAVARYTKDTQGRVIMDGVALFSGTTQQNILTLPSTYRPTQTRYISGYANYLSGGKIIAMAINTSGILLVVNVGDLTGLAWVSLASIDSFPTI